MGRGARPRKGRCTPPHRLYLGEGLGAPGRARPAQTAPRQRAGPPSEPPRCSARSLRSRLCSISSLRCASSCACGRAVEVGAGRGRPPPRLPAPTHRAPPPRYLQRLRCAPSRPPPGLTCCLGRAARGAGTCSSASCPRRSAAFSRILRCSSSTRSSREGAPAAADCAFFSSHLGGRRGWLRTTPPRVDSRDLGAGGEAPRGPLGAGFPPAPLPFCSLYFAV